MYANKQICGYILYISNIMNYNTVLVKRGTTYNGLLGERKVLSHTLQHYLQKEPQMLKEHKRDQSRV